MDDDDIVFDRDTSVPKKKLKDRKRRKGKSTAAENTANLNKVLNSSNNVNNNDDKNGKNKTTNLS